MNNWFYSTSETKNPEILQIGGKALNLALMQRANIKIPQWFSLTVSLFEEFMGEKLKELDLLLVKEYQSIDEMNALSSKIEEMILERNFKAEIKGAIWQKLKSVFGTGETHFFAIRSSAVDEDSKNYSFAGQLDSFLYIKADESLFENIKKCFASAFSNRVMHYRFQSKIPLKNIRPSVILQQMIFAEVSGVIFTGNPLSNNPDEMLINSLWGMGEGIVSGALNSDLWVINDCGEIQKKQIVEKPSKIVFDNITGYGTHQVSVEESTAKSESLDENKVIELVNLAKEIEKFYGMISQDIEWCMKGDTFFILQARPVTTMSHIDKSKYKTILDNSNIIESYPGVTTPLTFTFANSAYESVYKQSLEVFGVKKSKIASLPSVFRNMILYFEGKIYYDMNNWYELIKMLPGYKTNKVFLESMMGVKGSVSTRDQQERHSLKEKIQGISEMFYAAFCIILSFATLKRSSKKFISSFYSVTEKYMDETFEGYSNRELMKLTDKMTLEVLNNWKVPIVNDLYAMVSYGMLKKRIEKMEGEGLDSLQNDLLCGQGELESTKPTLEIIRITNWIKQNPELLKLFCQESAEHLIHIILKENDPEFDEARRKIKGYISQYGFRCMNELKLEEDSIKEDPTFLFSVIKNYLKKEAICLEEMLAKETRIRKNAEDKIFKKVKGFKKYQLSKVINNTRFAVKNREELRFMRTKIFGIMRNVFNAMGRNFYKSGLIEAPKDIYFLHFNEIPEIIEGRSINDGILKEIIRLRKEVHQENLSKETHERMFFYGDMFEKNYLAIIFDQWLEAESQGQEGIFKGVPCSPGQVKGKVKVVLSPQDIDLNGEILVTKRTDPGWVPLFPSISGLIIERGSVLSHSAVVAREMGIPAVVGLRNITEKTKDNDCVFINGSSGVVEILHDLESRD